MRLEHQLVLSCSRTDPTNKHQDQILDYLHTDLNWNLILDFVYYHGLFPLFYWKIKNFAQWIPDPVLHCLGRDFKQNACRNLSLTQELIKIIQNLHSQNIPILSFKGPVLAKTAYQNLGLRQFIDLDILIPKSAIASTAQILIQQGYLPQFELQGWQAIEYTNIRSEHNFYSAQKDLSIDLHWSLILPSFSFHSHPEIIWSNPHYQSQVKLANQTILTLSPEALLLFLCVHSSKHDWSHLSWVCDIAQLLDQTYPLNWTWISQEVGHLGTQTMLDLGLWLAHHYFDAPLPEGWEQKLANSPKIQALAQQIETQWLEPNLETHNPFLMGQIYVQTMDDWRDRLWYWFDYIATPTPLEWAIIPLPHWLFFLYYPLRFIRLAWKYCWRFIKKSDGLENLVSR